MRCPLCGNAISQNQICPCATGTYILEAEPGAYVITGQPLGTIVEGPPDAPDGRRVDSRPASGGRSVSTTDSTGAMEAALTGPLERGREGEYRAVKNLIQVFRDRGDTVERASDAQDARGQDAILVINGDRVVIQVVTLPTDTNLWRDLASDGEASWKGTFDEAVKLVRAGLIHKKRKATGAILVLHAAHIGAVIGPKLVEAYFAAHGDVEEEFGVREAWLVGPTARSTIRLALV